MKKRLVSLLLAGCMTAMLSVAAFAADTTEVSKSEEASLKAPVSKVFKDVPADAWYVTGVQFVYNNDVMVGVAPDQFAPEAGFNRAMVVQTMYNRSTNKSYDKNAAPAFKDVTNKNAWYYDAVQWAAQRGVIGGYEDGTFRPNRDVTREEFATILYQASGSPSIINYTLPTHPDFKDVSAWAKNAMIWANRRHVINGVKAENGLLYLQPKGVATRAQAASMLSQYLVITG